MRQDRGYLPDESSWPMVGLVTTPPSGMANPRSSPDLSNVTVRQGLIYTRTGYRQLGDEVDGVPLAITTFKSAGGTEFLLVFTTDGIYLWDDDEWRDVSPSDWTCDERAIVSTTVAISNDGVWIVATNGSTGVCYWDGVTDTFELLTEHPSFSFPDFVTCNVVASWAGRLFLGGITKVAYWPFNVAWSDAGSSVNFTTGTAGEILLTECLGDIVAMHPLADRLAIYSEDSIILATYVGGATTFVFEQTVIDTRLLSGRAIVNLKAFHIFMGRENVQFFDGGRIDRTLSEAIHQFYREGINLELRHMAFAFVDKERNHVYLAAPTVDWSNRVYLLEYNVIDASDQRWTLLNYPHTLTAMGFWRQQNQLTWGSNEIVGETWGTAGGVWGSGAMNKDVPIRVLGFDNGVIGIADDIRGTDGGEPIASRYSTIDFTVPTQYQSELGRWVEIELELRGVGTCAVGYSINAGRTTKHVADVPLTSSWTHHKLDVDVVSRTLRVVIRSSKEFGVRWIRLWFRPVGAR